MTAADETSFSSARPALTDSARAFADELRTAAATGIAVEPLTERDDSLDVADAYAIQLANVEAAISSGRRVVGRKVGLTSRAMQEMLGVHEPDFGTLLDDMVVVDGDTVAMSRLLQPRVEAEIGFVLGRDLAGPGVTTVGALAAVEAVVPSIEIIDSRIIDWRINLIDTIADNGSSAMAALGTTLTKPEGLDLRLVGVLLDRNGQTVEHGLGVAALGHPANCLAWLANKLGEFGDTLRAGDIVLPGSLHKAIAVEAGDTVTARFTGLGSVTIRFVHDQP